MGRKGDVATIIPLCAYHHAEMHQVGAHTFEVLHRLPLRWVAQQAEEAWVRSGLTHIGDVVPGVLADLEESA